MFLRRRQFAAIGFLRRSQQINGSLLAQQLFERAVRVGFFAKQIDVLQDGALSSQGGQIVRAGALQPEMLRRASGRAAGWQSDADATRESASV